MSTDHIGSPAPQFSATELENSAPFDTDKRLRGETAKSLQEEILALLDAKEREANSRRRARKAQDVELRRQTVGIFLANLVALWLNRVDATRFLAIPFSNNAYSGLPVSLKTLKELRDRLEGEGLISVAPGYLKVDRWDEFEARHGRLTRLRATPLLLEMFERHEIGRPSVKHVTERGVIHVTDREQDIGPEPEDVSISRVVLAELNARLATATIELPACAWARVSANRGAIEGHAARVNSGDETAKALRRIFKHHWGRGGRIYGGWWMHLPKGERCKLTIDGEPTVELDYSRLHPTMLFARAEIELEFDPYIVPGINHPPLRDLGKRTFQRLINGKAKRDGIDISIRAAPGDVELLPSGMTFKAYLNLFKKRLEPVAPWFGTGVGTELQREDSNLAIEVLRQMSGVGALVLPIHDSFIVQSKYEDALRKAMGSIFRDSYGFYPVINKAG